MRTAGGQLCTALGTLHEAHLACMAPLLLPDTVSEKNTRGKLRSAVERGLSQKQFIILDSLNNIKVGNSLLQTATVCFSQGCQAS